MGGKSNLTEWVVRRLDHRRGRVVKDLANPKIFLFGAWHFDCGDTSFQSWGKQAEVMLAFSKLT